MDRWGNGVEGWRRGRQVEGPESFRDSVKVCFSSSSSLPFSGAGLQGWELSKPLCSVMQVARTHTLTHILHRHTHHTHYTDTHTHTGSSM